MSRKSKKMDYFLELALEAQLKEDKETNYYKSDEDIAELHCFSLDHENRMQMIVKLAKKRESHAKRKKAVLRVAVSIAVLLLVTSASIASVEAFRIPFLNLLFEVKEKSSIFGVTNDMNSRLTKKLTDYEPTYVPEAFAIDFVKELDDGYMIQYLNEEMGQWYLLTFKKEATLVSLDTEDGIVDDFVLGDRQFVKIVKGDDLRIIMYWKENQYELVGNISFDIAMAILKSID